jgi:hypothetical protein
MCICEQDGGKYLAHQITNTMQRSCINIQQTLYQGMFANIKIRRKIKQTKRNSTTRPRNQVPGRKKRKWILCGCCTLHQGMLQTWIWTQILLTYGCTGDICNDSLFSTKDKHDQGQWALTSIICDLITLWKQGCIQKKRARRTPSHWFRQSNVGQSLQQTCKSIHTCTKFSLTWLITPQMLKSNCPFCNVSNAR